MRTVNQSVCRFTFNKIVNSIDKFVWCAVIDSSVWDSTRNFIITSTRNTVGNTLARAVGMAAHRAVLDAQIKYGKQS